MNALTIPCYAPSPAKPKTPPEDFHNICHACGVDLDELNRSKNAADRGETLCNACEADPCRGDP